jgi:hypothetical protein
MGWIMTDWAEILRKYTNWWAKCVLLNTQSLDIQGLTGRVLNR